MESLATNSPLIVIVGPTASGKSALALHIAEKYGGEIVAADSRTLYKGMDIATAKPSAIDRQRVPHHLIDIATPDQFFTAADFKRVAVRAIADIARRHKLPILVGGSGLYIDAILFDFTFQSPADPALRRQLQALSIEALQHQLQARSIPLPTNSRNPRHLVRRLETGIPEPDEKRIRPHTLVIGLNTERTALNERIRIRVEAMFLAGLAAEAQTLFAKYGKGCTALQTIGYREFGPYLEGNQSLGQTKEQIIADTVAYAKRQRTWFNRNKSTHWVDKQGEVEDLITTFLSK